MIADPLIDGVPMALLHSRLMFVPCPIKMFQWGAFFVAINEFSIIDEIGSIMYPI
jgi:hypothetical protein